MRRRPIDRAAAPPCAPQPHSARNANDHCCMRCGGELLHHHCLLPKRAWAPRPSWRWAASVVILLASSPVARRWLAKHLYFTVAPDEFTAAPAFNNGIVPLPACSLWDQRGRRSAIVRRGRSIDTAGVSAANKAVTVRLASPRPGRRGLRNRKNVWPLRSGMVTAWHGGAVDLICSQQVMTLRRATCRAWATCSMGAGMALLRIPAGVTHEYGLTTASCSVFS